MNIEQILEIILELSYSQGFYGKLYEDLMSIKDTDEIAWSSIVETLEAKKFNEPLDLILYLEQ